MADINVIINEDPAISVTLPPEQSIHLESLNEQ